MSSGVRRPLIIFAQLLRAARGMPTASRRGFVRKAVRLGFEKHRYADVSTVPALLREAEACLDAICAQAEHLCAVMLYEPPDRPSEPLAPSKARGIAGAVARLHSRAKITPPAPASTPDTGSTVAVPPRMIT